MSNIDFKAQAEAMREALVTRRRDFHMHPELAFEEVRTAKIVAEELTTLGLEVQTGVGKTGVVGILEGDSDGPTVLVRADMDALPIHELNAVDYASTNPGVMHACGHDAHTTIALGVARLFASHRDQLVGRIKFVFQPAEETVGGAQSMVDDGVLENPRPDVTFGLHLWNSHEVGYVGLTSGPIMASATTFRIIIRGRGGHAASPHETNDPIACAAQLVLAVQTIVSRSVNPLDRAVLSVTYIHAGEAYNIIPQDIELRGTIRAFKTDVRDLIARRLHEITESLCLAMGCEAETVIHHNTKPVANDAAVTERLRGVFAHLRDDIEVIDDQCTMGAEDVGCFMDGIPGTYFFVGSANAERGLNYAHHHPRFDFDEDVLPLSVSLMAAAVADFVLPDR